MCGGHAKGSYAQDDKKQMAFLEQARDICVAPVKTANRSQLRGKRKGERIQKSEEMECKASVWLSDKSFWLRELTHGRRRT